MTDEPDRVDLESPDLAAAKRAAFEDLFPGVLADGVLDATRLGELLDTPVTAPAEGRERFGLMWAGKQEAVRSLLTPSRGALIPDFDKSVDFDTAENVFIEGDNLEVLKLLQKAYNDKVKLIYIDPPYNTGQEFIYSDDFSDGLRAYLEYTDQLDSNGNRISATVEAGGRRHSRWLSMIYPRLMLARNLLTQDGVAFLSIGESELSNVVALMNEIFGEENALPVFTRVTKRSSNNGSTFSPCTDYIVGFARDLSQAALFSVPLTPEQIKSYNRTDERGVYKEIGLFQAALKHGGSRYPIQAPDGCWVITPNGQPWRWNQPRFQRGLANGEIVFKKSSRSPLVDPDTNQSVEWNVYTKLYLADREASGLLPKNFSDEFQNTLGTRDLRGLGVPFDFPKPVALMKFLVSIIGDPAALVLDFFAGSGTMGQAVAELNGEDGGSRRFVLVQLPERTAPNSDARKANLVTVADVCRLRLKRAIELNGEWPCGLRSFRLGPSNFRGFASDAETLFDSVETTLERGDDSLAEIAGEILLKEGVRLDATWSRIKTSGACVIVADGVAVVLSLDITDAVASEALALDPRVLVFLEDGFAGRDAVKANAFTNAKNLGITMKTV